MVDEPYTSVNLCAYAVNLPAETVSLENLGNFRVVYVIGTKLVESTIVPDFKGGRINGITGFETGLKMLLLGRADLFINMAFNTDIYLHQTDFSSIKKLSPSLVVNPVGII